MSISQEDSDKLLEASTSGDVEAVTRLLQQGASVLSKQRNGNTGLHLSARQGHDNIVKLFLDYETSVNIRGAGTYTPLMQAAECGHVGTTRLLIDNEADLELRNSDGKTALCSASGDFPDVVSELLTRGSREDVTNNTNETALQQAETFGCFDVIKKQGAE